MNKDEIEALVDKRVADAKTEWAKTRGWRHDRWASIKADPQAAAVMAVSGAVAWHFAGAHVLKFIGF